MSKINKIITNKPITLTQEEVANLSETLSAVRTAGGGGGGGATYGGDGIYIEITGNNTITLTTTAANQLSRPIPTKVSDLTDSANYATVESLTAYQAAGDYLSANALDSLSGTWNTVTQKLDTTAFSTVSGDFLTAVPAGYATETWVENKHYLSAVPDTYYTKSQTSGASELAAAFGNILDYDVTAAAGIEITTATDNGTTTFGISMTAEPVVTDTNLSGYNGIAAAPDGTKSGWWNVGLTQDMLNVINGKEDILSFSYDGNTITAINTSAVGKEFDGVVTAGSLSGDGTTTYPLGLKTSAEDALVIAKELEPPLVGNAVQQWIWQTKTTAHPTTPSGWIDFQEVFDSNFSLKFFDEMDEFLENTFIGHNGISASWVETATNQWEYQVGLDNTNLVADTQYAWTTTGWDEVSTPTIPAITAESGISADGYKIGLTTTAINAITSVSSKVDKPSSLVDKYLVLRTDSNGDVSGWCDFQDQSYSKSEALGTFVATANIDTTTLSGDGKSVSTKLGVKTDVIATRDYVNSSFLPTSGGTVSGQLVVSGGSNFDQENLKFIRTGQNGYGRIGLASNGALAVKVDDSNSNTTQINVAANASYNELIQVQHGGTTAYLIPAVTATTTAGLTNDGILHIILES